MNGIKNLHSVLRYINFQLVMGNCNSIKQNKFVKAISFNNSLLRISSKLLQEKAKKNCAKVIKFSQSQLLLARLSIEMWRISIKNPL